MLDSDAGTSARPAVAPLPVPVSKAPGEALSSTLLVLASSLKSIDARLRSLENAGASAPVAVPPSASAPLVPTEEPLHTLASAVSVLSAGRPYIPSGADITPRLRSHILQGRNINLIRLILPSPECDVSVSNSDQYSTVLRSADPRLARDLSIGEFLVAFGIFRDVVCSVFPNRRQELDGYMALIGDLNLRYGRNLFYQYHKEFSSKAARYVSHSNVLLNWSVLDTKLLVMLVGGSQAVSCGTCGGLGHSAPLCPLVPFLPEDPGAQPRTRGLGASIGKSNVDVRGRKVHVASRRVICNNFNESVCSYGNCNFLHICSGCQEAHPWSVCPRRGRPQRGRRGGPN